MRWGSESYREQRRARHSCICMDRHLISWMSPPSARSFIPRASAWPGIVPVAVGSAVLPGSGREHNSLRGHIGEPGLTELPHQCITHLIQLSDCKDRSLTRGLPSAPQCSGKGSPKNWVVPVPCRTGIGPDSRWRVEQLSLPGGLDAALLAGAWWLWSPCRFVFLSLSLHVLSVTHFVPGTEVLGSFILYYFWVSLAFPFQRDS